MNRHRIEPVNHAEPNWKHNHPSIRCRMDWKGAKVFFFPKEECLLGGIIAYSIADALSVLENIKSPWDKDPNGKEYKEKSEPHAYLI